MARAGQLAWYKYRAPTANGFTLGAVTHAARAGYHLPETGSLKAKSPPTPKGKPTEIEFNIILILERFKM